MLDVEEAAVAAAAAASAQSSKHDPAKGQWDFAQRAQRAALAEEQAAAASGGRSAKKGQHQRHGSGSDREGPVHRQGAEVHTHILLLLQLYHAEPPEHHSPSLPAYFACGTGANFQ